jgi:hypothetical protein
VIFGDPAHAWFGPRPGWWPGWLPFSPALIILPFPGLFRVTCYYYRGAYYKAFWADPPACSVGEPRKSYRGEKRFPLILQNIHRYFLYVAVIFLGILLYDVYKALWFTNDTTGQTEFGIGIGTLVLATNVVLLGGYTFGCHSLRHIVGGHLDRARRPRHRRRRRGAPGRDRSSQRRRARRRHLQVASRESAHGDGRGRRGGFAGECRRSRQLACALRRHDARRPVSQ